MKHASITFSPADGAIRIEGCPTAISAQLTRDEAFTAFAAFYRDGIDHKNGYEWLHFQGLNLGGQSCGLSLCFHQGELEQVHWGVALPDAELDQGWPTRETSDKEIEFVRGVLRAAFGRSFTDGQERFAWGVVWCVFDPKSFVASSGLRYGS